MYCRKCGTKLEEHDKFCTNCGVSTDISTQQTEKNEVMSTNDNINKEENGAKDNATVLCVSALVLFFGSSTIFTYLSQLIPTLNRLFVTMGILGPFAGIILMIVARVKYPTSKFAKVTMWIFIILIALGILGIILIISCVASCVNELR